MIQSKNKIKKYINIKYRNMSIKILYGILCNNKVDICQLNVKNIYEYGEKECWLQLKEIMALEKRL